MFLSIEAKAIHRMLASAKRNAFADVILINKKDCGIKMPRNLVFLIVFLVAIIGAMFLLASMDVEQELKPVEKPVIGGALK
ncbi:MAG: hypothetical protein V7676_00780 [Parasphingorhabdus sp.]|uniref:hypothetical protein n=1 Tax=Parasphingorhabdus sp. TaxID=2709688 RepID=UPI0030024394